MDQAVFVRCRGLALEEGLLNSAREWCAAIGSSVRSGDDLEFRVSFNRSAPEWGGATSARVHVGRPGVQGVVGYAENRDPYQALEASFRILAERIQRYPARLQPVLDPAPHLG